MYNRFTEKRRRYPCSTGTVSTLGCFLSRLSRGFSAQFDIYFRSGIRAWDYPQNRRVSGQRLCLLIHQIPVFSAPTPLFLFVKKLCYNVRKSARGGLSYGTQTGICRVLQAVRRKAHLRCPGAQGHRHRRVHRGLQGRQLCQRRQRALLPHPVHVLLRAGRSRWRAAG